MSRRDDEQMDEDLKENLDEEEMAELLEEENVPFREDPAEERKKRHPFSKWLIILITFFMFLSVISALPRTFSIPAIDFLITSAKLYTDGDVREYKESVVVVEAGEKKGTGFSYTPDGEILTNHHVIEGEERISVSFEEKGLYSAEVTEEYEEIDLAVLKVSGKNLPHLELAEQTEVQGGLPIRFIGNPLRFIRIANEGEIIGTRELEGWEKEVMVLDAPVYQGNSGSPVINEEGEVTGIIFATLETDDRGKVGLAVPVEYFHKVNR